MLCFISITDVNEFDIEELSLYPNPASDKVSIKWNGSEDVGLRIYNATGRIVFYGKKVNLKSGYTIDVSAFSAGAYFVKLNTSVGEMTKKLILK